MNQEYKIPYNELILIRASKILHFIVFASQFIVLCIHISTINSFVNRTPSYILRDDGYFVRNKTVNCNISNSLNAKDYAEEAVKSKLADTALQYESIDNHPIYLSQRIKNGSLKFNVLDRFLKETNNQYSNEKVGDKPIIDFLQILTIAFCYALNILGIIATFYRFDPKCLMAHTIFNHAIFVWFFGFLQIYTLVDYKECIEGNYGSEYFHLYYYLNWEQSVLNLIFFFFILLGAFLSYHFCCSYSTFCLLINDCKDFFPQKGLDNSTLSSVLFFFNSCYRGKEKFCGFVNCTKLCVFLSCLTFISGFLILFYLFMWSLSVYLFLTRLLLLMETNGSGVHIASFILKAIFYIAEITRLGINIVGFEFSKKSLSPKTISIYNFATPLEIVRMMMNEEVHEEFMTRKELVEMEKERYIMELEVQSIIRNSNQPKKVVYDYTHVPIKTEHSGNPATERV